MLEASLRAQHTDSTPPAGSLHLLRNRPVPPRLAAGGWCAGEVVFSSSVGRNLPDQNILPRRCCVSRGLGREEFCYSWNRGQEAGSPMVFPTVEQKTKDERKRLSNRGEKSQKHHQNVVYLPYFSKGRVKISPLPGVTPLGAHCNKALCIVPPFFSPLGQCPFCFRTFWAACQSLLLQFHVLKAISLNQTAHSARALEVFLWTCQVLKCHTVGRVTDGSESRKSARKAELPGCGKGRSGGYGMAVRGIWSWQKGTQAQLVCLVSSGGLHWWGWITESTAWFCQTRWDLWFTKCYTKKPGES